MLEEIITDPKLRKYFVPFETGQIIYTDGDDSQDLYILVSGQLEVIKGNNKIAEITETGSLFGEMSFLLGAKRTITVKAKNKTETFRIPKEEVHTFLRDFPSLSGKITTNMAQRLHETMQILHGLREFCDKLPDAVILTDRNGRVLTWNTAAENLYGRDANEMHHKPVDVVYEDPVAYKTFLGEVQSRYSVKEKILKVHHPEKGRRYISTSTTLLYDGHHNFQGVLSLGRDVTAAENLQRKYRRTRYWLIPVFIFFCLGSVAFFLGYPFSSGGHRSTDAIKLELKNQLAKDYLLLKSLLLNHYENPDPSEMSRLMKEYFSIQETSVLPYTGVALLNAEKKVFNAFSTRADANNRDMIGSSYAGIEFQGSKKSLHKVLVLYRPHKDYPMGRKYIEIAFEMTKENRFLGWIVFQMDMEMLERDYGVTVEDLIRFQFQKS